MNMSCDRHQSMKGHAQMLALTVSGHFYHRKGQYCVRKKNMCVSWLPVVENDIFTLFADLFLFYVIFYLVIFCNPKVSLPKLILSFKRRRMTENPIHYIVYKRPLRFQCLISCLVVTCRSTIQSQFSRNLVTAWCSDIPLTCMHQIIIVLQCNLFF